MVLRVQAVANHNQIHFLLLSDDLRDDLRDDLLDALRATLLDALTPC